ncbi:unnamed protein product [Cyprideis torosa]|uniref:Peptidase S1 domain-containing protein n=1 Tax=Cyprideis torosa TaxID=163714 RepID=A0A7R8WQC5_9CRUS|nr:unnamed protein product [Cyprideis torosa]CAG0905908.1 unnamed protein product [Cyprideis torosa]
MLERLGLFRRQNPHSFPMDPNTVVTASSLETNGTIWKSDGPLPEKVVAMGWGLMETEYDPHPMLVKRPKTARKRWIHVVDCDWIPNDKPGCHAYHLCQDNTEGGACQGDSGAPIVGYEKSLESWVQVGVHSMRNGERRNAKNPLGSIFRFAEKSSSRVSRANSTTCFSFSESCAHHLFR